MARGIYLELSMPQTTSNVRPLLTPEEVGDVLVTPVLAASVAPLTGVTTTLITTDAPTFRVPRVVTDPQTGWTSEGAEIPISNATFDEVVVTPYKTSGLVVASTEALEDTSEEAREQVGAGLVRQIARDLDRAFLGDQVAPNAPAGLESTDYHLILPTLPVLNTDPFAEAAGHAETLGTAVTAWIVHPTTLLMLSTMKEGDGSARPLLSVDPTEPSRRIIEGRPVISSPDCEQGVAWGVPADRVVTVVRSDSTVDVDESVYFRTDQVAIRGRMRVGFGFTQGEAITKIQLTAVTP